MCVMDNEVACLEPAIIYFAIGASSSPIVLGYDGVSIEKFSCLPRSCFYFAYCKMLSYNALTQLVHCPSLSVYSSLLCFSYDLFYFACNVFPICFACKLFHIHFPMLSSLMSGIIAGPAWLNSVFGLLWIVIWHMFLWNGVLSGSQGGLRF